MSVLDGTRERCSRQLAGSTMGEALEWLSRFIADEEKSLSLPNHEMPEHPLRTGAPFSLAHMDARTELAAWFANASATVGKVTAEEPNASPVRCWPHHFDVASLITIDSDEDAEEARSIGVGFSPGDGSYDQPYFYVTPWPYPDANALPELSGGARWHTDGWMGAVLTAEQLISTSDDRQAVTLQKALFGAIRACRSLLER